MRVTITTQPASDDGAILCQAFATPSARPWPLASAARLGLGLTGEMSEDEVRADLQARWPHARIITAPEALAPAIAALIAGRGDITVRLTGPVPVAGLAGADRGAGGSGHQLCHAGRHDRTPACVAGGRHGGRAEPGVMGGALPPRDRTDGSIGGYHWGAAIKRALFAREGASIAPAPSLHCDAPAGEIDLFRWS